MSVQSILEDLVKVEVESCGGVSQNAILDAESKIGLNIPNSYKQYLLRYGAAIFEDNYELFGLPSSSEHQDEQSFFSNLIVEAERYIEQKGFEGMIHILHNGCSDAYFLDTQNGTEEDCPVVLSNSNVGFVRYSDTFEDFLGIYLARGIDEHADLVEKSGS